MLRLLPLIFVFCLDFREVFCICEESYIVICDNLEDIGLNAADYGTWKHVQIGSIQSKFDNSNRTLTLSHTIHLTYTKSLIIINQIRLIKVPFTASWAKKYEYLNFYKNNIIEIEDHTFENFTKLKEIYLKNNNIQHLGRGVFKNTNLDVVDLSRNQIESITTCFYESNIKWILLNKNRIRFIKRNAFPKTLEQLELNYNDLHSLENDVFEYLTNLKELFLKNNYLTTLPPNLSSMKNLHYLHLANNNITKIDFRFDVHVPKLEFLDLSSNQISNVDVSAFSSNGSPPIVMLAFNHLNNLKFTHPEKKTDLVLYGNPWICKCLFEIEKIISANRHMTSCEFKFFDKGDIPFCINDGECRDQKLSKSKIDEFHMLVNVLKDKIQNECKFRLDM